MEADAETYSKTLGRAQRVLRRRRKDYRSQSIQEHHKKIQKVNEAQVLAVSLPGSNLGPLNMCCCCIAWSSCGTGNRVKNGYL